MSSFESCGKSIVGDKMLKSVVLRTVPPFSTAHTFCASPDGPSHSDFLRTVPTNSKEFCTVYDYAGKKIFARAIGIQKENWG